MKYLFKSINDIIYNWKTIKSFPIKANVKNIALCIWGFSVNDILNYNLKNKKFLYCLYEFIPYHKRVKYRGNPSKGASHVIINNKHLTIKYLVKNAIPTTDLKFLIISGRMYSIDKELNKKDWIGYMPKGKFVIKPIDKRWGIGIKFINNENEIIVIESPFIQEITENDNISTFIVEDEITNHPTLQILSTHSLNTLRVITVLKHNKVNLIFACIRFSSNETKIDNWSSGGFAANVDINTGKADSAIKKNDKKGVVKNEISNGLVIPFFDESKKMVSKAHYLFPDIKSIGWDIAITKDGPIIIECNDDWDVILPQKLLGTGIKKLVYA